LQLTLVEQAISSLQDLTSESSPLQGAPVRDPLTTLRDLDMVPPLQVLEHTPQVAHAPSSQSTFFWMEQGADATLLQGRISSRAAPFFLSPQKSPWPTPCCDTLRDRV
jgi:hypothetical protein